MILHDSPAAPIDLPPCDQNRSCPILVHNLLNDLDALAPLLLTALRWGLWLNAYLLAAGMNQIAEDYLQRGPATLDKAAKLLVRIPRPVGAPAAKTARGVATITWHAHRRTPRAARLIHWQAGIAALVQRLADMVVSAATVTDVEREQLMASAETLLAPLPGFPVALRRDVLRLPSCFRSFDQRPADLERLVSRFSHRWPNRDTRLVVVGVRTSGSYLAPLCASYLKSHGYRDVAVLTMRPGHRMSTGEQAMLRATTAAHGLVLLTDDPPSSGAALKKAARELERLGVSSRSIVLLVQVFGTPDALPITLNDYASVILPWDEWAIHEQLAVGAVRDALATLVDPGTRVSAIEHVPLPPRTWVRGHVRALYDVQLTKGNDDRHFTKQICVRGAGLGYFGEHALAVERRLEGAVPRLYGVASGLVYREWLPEERRLSSLPPHPDLSVRLAAYVAARNEALAVEEDVSKRLVNRDPAWQRASDLFSQAFGRAAPAVRPVFHHTAQRLLHVTQPSVVDGSMAPSRWFTNATGERVLKVDVDERAFCNLDMYCYDPVFDLAGIAVSWDSDELARGVRRAYEQLTGETIGEERWLLYRLLHLGQVQREHGHGERPDLQRAQARVYQHYVARLFFDDLRPAEAGPLCAIDIDGVLETGALGFPAITPAGCVALRSLTQHGYRPVLVTGRSLDDVRERCRAYCLTGGVAEYGAVVYNHNTGHARHLLSDGDRADLAQLRVVLSDREDVYLDPDYQYAVRAYCLDQRGRRCGLSQETIATALAASGTGDRVRAIIGMAQTDFMAAGIDKGAGLHALGVELRAGPSVAGAKLVALAVGDTVSDLPMFALAEHSCAPANADFAVRNARATGMPIKIMKRLYQPGLAEGAAILLGHSPGGCSTCRVPRMPAEANLLLAVLGAQDTGKWGKVKQALVLAALGYRK